MAVFGDEYYFSVWWGWLIFAALILASLLCTIGYEFKRSRNRRSDGDWVLRVSVFKIIKKLVFALICFYIVYMFITFSLSIMFKQQWYPQYHVFSTRLFDFYRLHGVVSFVGFFLAFAFMPCVFVGLWKPSSQGSRMMIDFTVTLFLMHFVVISFANLNFPYQWQFWLAVIPSLIVCATCSEIFAYRFETMAYRAKGSGKTRKEVIEEKKERLRVRRARADGGYDAALKASPPASPAPEAVEPTEPGPAAEGIVKRRPAGRVSAAAAREGDGAAEGDEGAGGESDAAVREEGTAPVAEARPMAGEPPASPRTPRREFVDLTEQNMQAVRHRYGSLGADIAPSPRRRRSPKAEEAKETEAELKIEAETKPAAAASAVGTPRSPHKRKVSGEVMPASPMAMLRASSASASSRPMIVSITEGKPTS